jgi:pimeloyl-ACP methyl ester carboxylesterase
MKSILLAAAFGLGLTTLAAAQGPKTGYAPVNGLEMYYEVHGEGEPLVLLHGAYMNNENNWAGIIPTLAETHQVIAVELQGHGRTNDRDTPITYEGMARDVADLLDHLGVEKAALFGYSMGGSVAIRFAIDYPQKVSRIVAASGGYSYGEEVMGKEFMAMIESISPEMFAGTIFESEYKTLAPKPENFPVLVDKLRQLDLTPFDWSAEFAKIEVPSLYIFGDADIVDADYIARMHELAGGLNNGDMNGLPKTQLAVLPGSSHTGVFFNPANVELMKLIVPAFLEADLPQPPQMTMQ